MKVKNKIHPVLINNIKPSKKLGRNIMSLRYDLIIPIIDEMLEEIKRQEFGDKQKGRLKLSSKLGELSHSLTDAKKHLKNIVEICSPYIEKEKIIKKL